MNEFEIGILDFIAEHLHCSFLDAVIPIITMLGNAGIFWILLAIAFLCFRKTRPLGIAMGFALILDLLCCNILLKPLVNRIRPYDVKEALDGIRIELLIKAPTDSSFPSGHTAASFASCFALFFKKSKIWIPAFILAVLIAFSRLYLYVHFPTDILGGIAVGILVGWLGAFLSGKLEKVIKKKYPNAL
ncbi:MAG: phosphatase PAP2 family protein [Eubacteriales bacterium]